MVKLLALFISVALAGADLQVSIERKELTGCATSGGACLKDAAAVPHLVDGKVVGWKLKQIKKGSLFTRLKFKEGDVILTANGEPLTDASRSLYWMMQITTVKSVKLGILRKGKPLSIECRITD